MAAGRCSAGKDCGCTLGFVREKRKEGLYSYGFLLDRDVAKVASLFPKKRTRTAADIGLSPDAPDSEIIREAWERRLTIVTGNGDHFLKEIHKFLAQTKRDECHEMYGLLILPSAYERQKRLLQNIESRLRLGTEKLTWADVADRNCCVKVARLGAVEVRRFPRCLLLPEERTEVRIPMRASLGEYSRCASTNFI